MQDPTVYLTQTDTTIGFVSQDAARLDTIKGRPAHKQYIRAVDSLATLKMFTRVPLVHRNRLRRARKITFVFRDGPAFRLIRDPRHLALIGKLQWAFTTSANRSGEAFDETWARSVADVTIEPITSVPSRPSVILKLGGKRVLKLR